MSNIIRKIKSILRNLFKKEKELVPILIPIGNDTLLKGKIVMITGGTGGIGFAIAQACVKAGAKVIICGTNTSKLDKFQKILGVNSRTLVLHLNDVDSLEKSVRKALQCYPENRIDILVNSAGVHGDWSIKELSVKEYDKVMDVNVKGTFFLTNSYIYTNNIFSFLIDNCIKCNRSFSRLSITNY